MIAGRLRRTSLRRVTLTLGTRTLATMTAAISMRICDMMAVMAVA